MKARFVPIAHLFGLGHHSLHGSTGFAMSILLIHTGGTIGMDMTEKGFAPSHGVLENALHQLKQRGEFYGEVDIRLFEPAIDSANATPEDWNRLAEAIASAHSDYEGFVVTHGTDTLAFTSNALCLSLQGLEKPVILTGSMVPLTQRASDGWRNLTDALDAATLAPPGVWVQFAGRRLHGARVRKSHSSSPDAFEATKEPLAPRIPAPELQLRLFGQFEIAVLSVAPGVSARAIRAALSECDGVVLRCYGSGTAPNTPELRIALEDAKSKGKLILAVSQCPEGKIALGTYAAGEFLIGAGVVDGADITVEAAYVKLAHVLSRNLPPAKARKLLAQVLCGEASI